MRKYFLRSVAAASLAALALATPVQMVLPQGLLVSVAQAESLSVAAARKAIAGDFSGAGDLAQQSGDAAAIKLVELLYLKEHSKDAGFARIVDFVDSNPNWPLAQTLERRAEEALYAGQPTADVVLEHFARTKPETVHGQLALARALYATGDSARAKAALLAAWYSSDLESDLEGRVLKEFGSEISAAAREKRVWRLILAQQPNGAVRNAKRVGGGIVAAADAALKLLREVSGAEKSYGALPAALKSQPAMKYALARYYRRMEKWSKARETLASISGDTAAMIDAEAIWTERRIIARRSLGPGQKEAWPTAYRVAARHGLGTGAEAVDGDMLAGWIALRKLNDAATAIGHFERAGTLAQTRTDKSRVHYWMGRALKVQGDEQGAAAQFNAAAKFTTLYYGQLAREEIGLGNVPGKIAAGGASDAARRKVEADELVRAFRIMNQAGTDAHLNMFLAPLTKRFSTADEMNAVADIVASAGTTSMALRFAKAAGQRGIDIDSWAYPIRGLPDWRQVGKPVEKPLVFALSRQESEFNPTARSGAGALGLMQMMPGTARIVAKQNGMSYSASRLVADPAYNVKLGAAHLADLVSDNGGSYILTLVAYNAGPRRATEWIAQYGDPRSSKVDPIDWVESIPFQETRQYVQKVMQNLHVYRARLAPDSARPMSADLRRGGSAKVNVAENELTSSTSCAGASIGALIKSCE